MKPSALQDKQDFRNKKAVWGSAPSFAKPLTNEEMAMLDQRQCRMVRTKRKWERFEHQTYKRHPGRLTNTSDIFVKLYCLWFCCESQILIEEFHVIWSSVVSVKYATREIILNSCLMVFVVVALRRMSCWRASPGPSCEAYPLKCSRA